MVYSIPQRKFILETYLKTKSYKKVRQLFIEKFNKTLEVMKLSLESNGKHFQHLL
jgi:hypothetical protein